MKNKFLLLTFLMVGGMAAHAQTVPVSSTKANLQKAKANPSIKEQQAKADVHVVKKSPAIVDTLHLPHPANTSSISIPSTKKSKHN